MRTNKKYIKINDLLIPTCGYIFSIENNNNKYDPNILNKDQINTLKIENNILLLKTIFHNCSYLMGQIDEHLKNGKTTDGLINIWLKSFKFDYDDVIKYCKHINNYDKLLNIFYKLIIKKKSS